MKQYLLSIYQPDGPVPPKEFLDKVMADVAAVNEELRAAGVWVFAAGLHPPETSTVLKNNGKEVLMTDGPYIEGKEHLGGFSVIRAADLDEAIGWARKLSRAIPQLAIEVRPMEDGHC
jgi:hypothetical protein